MSTAAAANARAAACKRFFEITATEPGHLAELSDWEVFVKNALAQVVSREPLRNPRTC